MTSLFRSAAMALLSKTLQTLLYKYLEDVDVEGVALPTFYSTSSTGSSTGHSASGDTDDSPDEGWGVRLCNVKLRAGTNLLKLQPLKVQRRRRRKRRKVKPTTTNEQITETVNPSSSKSPSSESTTATAIADPQKEQSNDDTTSNTKPSEEFHPIKRKKAPQKSSSWFGGWYGSKNTSKESTESTESDPANDANDTKVANGGVHEEETTPPVLQHAETISSDERTWNNKEPPTEHLAKDTQSSTTLEEEDVEFYYEDVEEDIPMCLQTGPNGCIGTIDVRIVGKDIHVLVEDADVTLEAVQAPVDNTTAGSDAQQSASGPNSTSSSTHATTTTNKSSSADTGTSQSSSAASTTKSTKKDDPLKNKSLDTVADRVMAENPLARILSVLPNLLLRDIRVRLLVHQPADDSDRDDPSKTRELPEDEPTVSDSSDANDPSTSNLENQEEKSTTIDIVEVAIELLSITDGQDFFAHFRDVSGDRPGSKYHAGFHDDDGDSDSSSSSSAESRQEHESSLPQQELLVNSKPLPQNEYLKKRIRTGRGPEGGIVIRVFHDDSLLDMNLPRRGDPDEMSTPYTWPRERWLSTVENYCLLRLSGLDIQARVFLGTKTEVELSKRKKGSWYQSTQEEDEDLADYDFSVDSMLFGGVDYVVPGPQPVMEKPLPPIAEDEDGVDAIGEMEQPVLWELPGATTYQLDENDIQSSMVATSFHRVARGLKPCTCYSTNPDTTSSNYLLSHNPNHLPCEYCNECWQLVVPPNQSISPKFNEEIKEHRLDSSAPMGGFTCHVSVRDVLELNLDRPALSFLGSLIGLFRKPPKPTQIEDASLPEGTDASNSTQQNDTKASRAEPSLVSESDGETPENETQEDISESFPSYMQPEKIQYLGLHVSKIQLRVHLIPETKAEGVRRSDKPYSFSYWDAEIKCLTGDIQKLKCEQKLFQDIRFDAGHVVVTEHSGVVQKQLCSIGLRQQQVDFDEVTVETLMTREDDCQRPPWPSTAAVLLDIPPPLETLIYETRERHAFQLRYVSLMEPISSNCFEPRRIASVPDRSQTMLHAKLGAASVNVPQNIHRVALTTINRAKACIFPPLVSNPTDPSQVTKKPPPAKKNSLLKYRVDLDGARAQLDPKLLIRLPLSTVSGETSTLAGFSIESALNHVEFEFGEGERLPILTGDCRLSLSLMSELPESLRTKILFFLDDLTPLAVALGVKGASDVSSPFLLHKDIWKQIDKLTRRQSKKSKSSAGLAKPLNSLKGRLGAPSRPENRRQEIMADLLKLNDAQLESLWETHMRRERRTPKQRTKNRSRTSTS